MAVEADIRGQALGSLDIAKSHPEPSHRLEAIKALRDIVLRADSHAFILHDFACSLPDLQTSSYPAVRRYLVEMIEDISLKNIEHACRVSPFLFVFLKDDMPAIVRQTITCGANIFCCMLDQINHQIAHKGKLDDWLEKLWSWALNFKDEVYRISFQIGMDGAKFLAVKFIEIVILLFTPDGNGHFNEGKPRGFNSSLLVGGHPLLDPSLLFQEAQKCLGFLLEQLQPTGISVLSSSVIIVIINSLAAIAKKRLLLYERIVPLLLGLDPSSESGKGGQVASVQHALKTALLTCLKCTNEPEASMWQERLVSSLRILHAGEQAEQVVRQLSRMLRNAERASRDPRITKEERGLNQGFYVGGSVRKRPIVHDNGLSTNMDETSSKRQRSSQFPTPLQHSESPASNSTDNVPSNGMSVGGIVLDNELTPAQKMNAMIAALLAEGERGRGSLELLISEIQPDLLADIVIANMEFLPTSPPPMPGGLSNLFPPAGSQSSTGNILSTTQVSTSTSQTTGSVSPVSKGITSAGTLSRTHSITNSVNSPLEESVQHQQSSSDVRRDPRRDPRRMDPRRLAVPIGGKSVPGRVEDSSITSPTAVGSPIASANTPVVKSEVPSEKFPIDQRKSSSLQTEPSPMENKTGGMQETANVLVVPESSKSSVSGGVDLTSRDTQEAGSCCSDMYNDEQLVQDSSNEEILKSSDESPVLPSEEESSELVKVPAFVSLTSKEQSLISKEAFTRIVEGFVEAGTTQGRDLRCAVIAHLVAECGEHIDAVEILPKRIVLNYQSKGHDVALHILYHLYRQSEFYVKEHASSLGTKLYEKFLLAVVEALRDSLPASDRSLNRLLGEAPFLPDSVLRVLGGLCNPDVSSDGEVGMSSGERVTQGLGAVWSLILTRPVSRIACLDIALQCTIHELDDVRAKAVRLVANRLYALDYLSHNIEEFATKMFLSVVSNEQISDSKQEPADTDHTYSDVKQEKMAGEEQMASESEIMAEKTQKTVGSDGQKGMQSTTMVSPAKAQRYMSLFLALCTKNHVLLNQIFNVYGQVPKAVKQVVHWHIPSIVRTIGSSPELLKIISDPPIGSEKLLTQVLHFLTEGKTPPADLIVIVKQLYETKLKDATILIPMLSSLSKEEVLPIFPRLVDLPLDNFHIALARILQGSVHTGPALTPAEVLIAIHGIDPEKDGIPLKKITDACSACFDQKVVFTPQVLQKVLNHLVEENPLPFLFMRTVIQAVGTFPNLKTFVMEILSRLIKRRIWRIPKLWVGFLKCAYQTLPTSLPVLLQLPGPQLQNALNKYPSLREHLAAHASKVRATVPRSVLIVLGLVHDNPTSTQSASTSQSPPPAMS